MNGPYLRYARPPSSGAHGLRRKGAVDALARVSLFLEGATDCVGAREVHVRTPVPPDATVRALLPEATWLDGPTYWQWNAPRRRHPEDASTVAPHRSVAELVRHLAGTGSIDATIAYQYLLRDPRTGQSFEYQADDFGDDEPAWSDVLLHLHADGRNAVSFVWNVPSPEVTSELVAVHDWAVATLGVALNPAHWYRVTPSKTGKLSTRTSIGFDRRSWVEADDGARLVYADALIERGDPRGALIVVEWELARTTDVARRTKLEKERRRLLKPS